MFLVIQKMLTLARFYLVCVSLVLLGKLGCSHGFDYQDGGGNFGTQNTDVPDGYTTTVKQYQATYPDNTENGHETQYQCPDDIQARALASVTRCVNRKYDDFYTAVYNTFFFGCYDYVIDSIFECMQSDADIRRAFVLLQHAGYYVNMTAVRSVVYDFCYEDAYFIDISCLANGVSEGVCHRFPYTDIVGFQRSIVDCSNAISTSDCSMKSVIDKVGETIVTQSLKSAALSCFGVDDGIPRMVLPSSFLTQAINVIDGISLYQHHYVTCLKDATYQEYSMFDILFRTMFIDPNGMEYLLPQSYDDLNRVAGCTSKAATRCKISVEIDICHLTVEEITNGICRTLQEWISCAACDQNAVQVVSNLTTCNITYDGEGGLQWHDSLPTTPLMPEHSPSPFCFGLDDIDLNNPQASSHILESIFKLLMNAQQYIDCLRSKTRSEYTKYDHLVLVVFKDLENVYGVMNQQNIAEYLPVFVACISNAQTQCSVDINFHFDESTVHDMANRICSGLEYWIQCAACDRKAIQVLSDLTTCNSTFDDEDRPLWNNSLPTTPLMPEHSPSPFCFGLDDIDLNNPQASSHILESIFKLLMNAQQYIDCLRSKTRSEYTKYDHLVLVVFKDLENVYGVMNQQYIAEYLSVFVACISNAQTQCSVDINFHFDESTVHDMANRICSGLEYWIQCAACDRKAIQVLSDLTTCNSTFDDEDRPLWNDSLHTTSSMPKDSPSLPTDHIDLTPTTRQVTSRLYPDQHTVTYPTAPSVPVSSPDSRTSPSITEPITESTIATTSQSRLELTISSEPTNRDTTSSSPTTSPDSPPVSAATDSPNMHSSEPTNKDTKLSSTATSPDSRPVSTATDSPNIYTNEPTRSDTTLSSIATSPDSRPVSTVTDSTYTHTNEPTQRDTTLTYTATSTNSRPVSTATDSPNIDTNVTTQRAKTSSSTETSSDSRTVSQATDSPNMHSNEPTNRDTKLSSTATSPDSRPVSTATDLPNIYTNEPTRRDTTLSSIATSPDSRPVSTVTDSTYTHTNEPTQRDTTLTYTATSTNSRPVSTATDSPNEPTDRDTTLTTSTNSRPVSTATDSPNKDTNEPTQSATTSSSTVTSSDSRTVSQATDAPNIDTNEPTRIVTTSRPTTASSSSRPHSTATDSPNIDTNVPTQRATTSSTTATSSNSRSVSTATGAPNIHTNAQTSRDTTLSSSATSPDSQTVSTTTNSPIINTNEPTGRDTASSSIVTATSSVPQNTATNTNADTTSISKSTTSISSMTESSTFSITNKSTIQTTSIITSNQDTTTSIQNSATSTTTVLDPPTSVKSTTTVHSVVNTTPSLTANTRRSAEDIAVEQSSIAAGWNNGSVYSCMPSLSLLLGSLMYCICLFFGAY
ncbi:uncharacterized protein [Argopecten irradians]|uniref:uncharacterized protein n=1 Tax=Argopecten irradians TaxID=31199 RepID=UPI00371D9D42